jgi:hypothetical protein
VNASAYLALWTLFLVATASAWWVILNPLWFISLSLRFTFGDQHEAALDYAADSFALPLVKAALSGSARSLDPVERSTATRLIWAIRVGLLIVWAVAVAAPFLTKLL